jgi:hypothetical protein
METEIRPSVGFALHMRKAGRIHEGQRRLVVGASLMGDPGLMCDK